jgi:hypothetical protein
MKPVATWGLAAAALAAGWFAYGWQGLVLAVTAIVFWLLLQFSRALRALRKAGSAPLGRVASAVMLHAKLREGMTLAQVLALTGSLGERVSPPAAGAEESWRWRDAGAASVTVHLRGGRTRHWALQRPDARDAAGGTSTA